MLSATAAISNSSSSPISSANTILETSKFPFVIVPVLSNTIVFAFVRTSK